MSTVVRGLTFSKALLGLQAGERLQREGWNGKNMWIALGAGSTALPADKFWNPHARQFAESNGGTATVDSYFIMKTAQGTIQMGWVPSQADMLANDWQTLVDEPVKENTNHKEVEITIHYLDPKKNIGEQINNILNSKNKSMSRNRPYKEQSHTFDGIRGSAEIKGITFRDLKDCYIRAILLSTGAEIINGIDTRPLYEQADKGELASLNENDVYGFNLDKLDPIAISQNLCCEVEKIMGIFPNTKPQGDTK